MASAKKSNPQIMPITQIEIETKSPLLYALCPLLYLLIGSDVCNYPSHAWRRFRKICVRALVVWTGINPSSRDKHHCIDLYSGYPGLPPLRDQMRRDIK
jgi:hypothetical protein